MPAALLSVYALTDAITALVARGDVQLRLFVNDYTPRFVSDVGNFVEASYDTYPAGGLVLNPTPLLQVGNRVRLNTLVGHFPAPTADGPVLVFGWFLTYVAQYDANTHVLASARFGPALVQLFNGGVGVDVTFDLTDFGQGNP